MLDYEQIVRNDLAAKMAAFKAERLQKKREEQEKAKAAAVSNDALLLGRAVEEVAAIRREKAVNVKLEREESEVMDRSLPRKPAAVREKAPKIRPEDIAGVKSEDEESQVVDRELPQSTALPCETSTSAQEPVSTEDSALDGVSLQRPGAISSTVEQDPLKDVAHLNLQARPIPNDSFDYVQITEEPGEEFCDDEDELHVFGEYSHKQDQERKDSEEQDIGNGILQIAQDHVKTQPLIGSKTASSPLRSQQVLRSIPASNVIVRAAPAKALLPTTYVLTSATKRKSTEERPAITQLKRRHYNANGTSQIEDHIVERPKTKTPKIGKLKAVSVEYIQPKAGVISTSNVFDLVNLSQLIDRYLKDYSSKNTNLLSHLRSQVQKANLAILPEQLPRTSNFEQILSRAINGPASQAFPLDVRRDIEMIIRRLKHGPADGSLLRGIYIKRSTLQDGSKRIWKVLDMNYKYKKDCNVIGASGLINGQWWLERVDAQRDGAHGSREAGIYGLKGHGAFSIVIASGGYADKDYGDIVEYCGTASKTSTPTTSTKYMEHTYVNRQALRVLRSGSTSEYAPSEGIRYDGLYNITSREVLDVDTAMYRYTLQRIAGQDPILYQGMARRPNPFELAERKKIKEWVDTL